MTLVQPSFRYLLVLSVSSAVAVPILNPANPPYLHLSDAQAACLVGGDDYDQFALCDGQGGCTECVPNICAPNEAETACTTSINGTPGCRNYALRTSCYSGAWTQDCWYYYQRVCGASEAPADCVVAVAPICGTWCANISGFDDQYPDCYNCETVP